MSSSDQPSPFLIDRAWTVFPTYFKNKTYYGFAHPVVAFTVDTDYDLLRDPQTPAIQPIRDQVDRYHDMMGRLEYIYQGLRDLNRAAGRPSPTPQGAIARRKLFEEFANKELRSAGVAQGLSHSFTGDIVALDHALALRDGIIRNLKERMTSPRLESYESWKMGKWSLPVVNWQDPAAKSQTTLETGNTIWDQQSRLTWNETVETMQVMYRDPTITLENAVWFITKHADRRTRLAICVAGVLCQRIRGNVDAGPLGSIAATCYADIENLADGVPHYRSLAASASVAGGLDLFEEKVDTIVARYLPRIRLESEIGSLSRRAAGGAGFWW